MFCFQPLKDGLEKLNSAKKQSHELATLVAEHRVEPPVND